MVWFQNCAFIYVTVLKGSMTVLLQGTDLWGSRLEAGVGQAPRGVTSLGCLWCPNNGKGLMPAWLWPPRYSGNGRLSLAGHLLSSQSAQGTEQSSTTSRLLGSERSGSYDPALLCLGRGWTTHGLLLPWCLVLASQPGWCLSPFETRVGTRHCLQSELAQAWHWTILASPSLHMRLLWGPWLLASSESQTPPRAWHRIQLLPEPPAAWLDLLWWCERWQGDLSLPSGS